MDSMQGLASQPYSKPRLRHGLQATVALKTLTIFPLGCEVGRGPHFAGLVGPCGAIREQPKPTAKCIMPVLPQMTRSDFFNKSDNCSISSLPEKSAIS